MSSEIRARAVTVALSVWIAVIAAGVVWAAVSPLDAEASITATPFFGRWAWHGTGWLIVAAVVALAVIGAEHSRVLGRHPVAVAMAASAAWTVSLAASDGWDRVVEPMRNPLDVLAVIERIDRPADFLRTFVDRIGRYPTHVRGHPPGAPLFFWALDRLGMGGPRWATLVVIGAWAVGAGLVVWTVRELGGDRTVTAATGVALLPAAIWAGTSTDAFYAGAAVATVALTVRATRPRSGGGRPWAWVTWSIAAGLAWGCLAFLSYGLVVLGIVALALCVARRRPDVLAVVVAAGGVVVVAFGAFGFWWWDGLAATREQYFLGLARVRPYAYFVFAGSPAAFALAVGPLVAVGIAVLLRRRTPAPLVAVVVGASLAAVLVADLSGMSKGEVERIWLPFALLLAAATSAVPSSRTRTVLLSVGAASAIAIQGWLATPW